jgi:hypothetical protein
MFRSLLYDHPQGSSLVLSAMRRLRLANDEANKRISGNALSTKDDP